MSIRDTFSQWAHTPQETHWKYLSFLGVQAEQYRILACKNALWKASEKKRSIKHRKWKGNPPKPCGQLRSGRFAHAVWNALLQAQLIICWSNTHASEVLLLSWAWGCWEERQVWSSPELSTARGPLHPLWCSECRAQEGLPKCHLKSCRHLPMGPGFWAANSGTQPVSEPGGTTIALIWFFIEPRLSDSPTSLIPLNSTRTYFFLPISPDIWQCLQTLEHGDITSGITGRRWRRVPSRQRWRLLLNILQYSGQPLKQKVLGPKYK